LQPSKRTPMVYLKLAIIGVSLILVIYGLVILADQILFGTSRSYPPPSSIQRADLWTAYTVFVALSLIFVGVNVFLFARALSRTQESHTSNKRKLRLFVGALFIFSLGVPTSPFLLLSNPLRTVDVPKKEEFKFTEGAHQIKLYDLPVAWKGSQRILFYLFSHRFRNFEKLLDWGDIYILHDDDPLLKRCHEVASFLHDLGFAVYYSNKVYYLDGGHSFRLSVIGSVALFEIVFKMRISYQTDEDYIGIYDFTTPLMPIEIRDFARDMEHPGSVLFSL